ncbi:TadE family type IV pilus minor pilin [Micromonospora sp. RTP1Z1]|uniref:TadE family type IV pilus minor pilin n=1 Tax=Micromonospora sp. RTP1Z1 TaxID=2994043 RepID=UPI0029C631FF|nr:TadE family type IV pilus minor pilin [Micromonospora sp. RTP1Z1]
MTGGGDRGSGASLDPGSRAALGRGHGAREATSDRGSFTAELAAGLPALVLLLLVGLTAVNAVTTRGGCLDAAREAALAAARGENGTTVGARYAPPGADVAVTVAGDRVTATVHVPVRTLGARLPRLTVSATAVAAVEPGAPAPRP